MKLLVINADDYNLTAGCDRAIEEAMRAGAVTSASCLVWDRRPELPDVMRGRTGLHLRLTDGCPVAVNEVPSLVGPDGQFPRSRDAVAALKVDLEDVTCEWYEQVRLFRRETTHLDTHRHTHALPGIDTVYEYNCAGNGCAGVPLSAAQRDRLRALGVRCADYAELRWLDGRLDTLQRLLIEDFARYETVHLMTHPGFVDDELRRKSGMVEVRRREFDALMDIGFASWLDSEGIEKIGMTQLEPIYPLEKIDIIFLAWNRPEYTAESLRALATNTDWDRVRRLIVYTDGEPMRNGYVAPQPIPDRVLEYDLERHGGPVAIMNHYLRNRNPLPWFAKIDNDVVLPPGWLETCLDVLRWHPEVDLLGIEAVNPSQHRIEPRIHEPEPTGHIGGIGLMRTAAFDELPVAAGRMGFSDWQIHHDVTKAWLNPSLPVILLDRLPFEPWASLGKEYEAKGWQRPWKRYTAADEALWSWWTK